MLSHLPSDEDALAIWEHVRWLARYDNFYELKRYRTHQPDLPGWKVPASKLTFGSRPWMPPVPDAHVPADGVPLKLRARGVGTRYGHYHRDAGAKRPAPGAPGGAGRPSAGHPRCG